MKYVFKIHNLDCGHCATKIEAALNKESYVKSAELNFVLKKLYIETDITNSSELLEKITALANEIEDGVEFENLNDDAEDEAVERELVKYVFEVHELDCANCGQKIENALNKEDYIESAELNFMLKKLKVTTFENNETELLHKITTLANEIEDGVQFVDPDLECDGESCSCQHKHHEHHHDGECHCHEEHEHEGHHHHHEGHNHEGHEHGEHHHEGHNHEEHHHESNKQVSSNGAQKVAAAKDTSSTKKSKLISKEQQKQLEKYSLGLGIALFILAIYLQNPIIYLASFICVGYDIVIHAVKNIFAGRMLDENFLMTVASIAAFVLGEYPEAVAVMLFYKIGETLQGKAVDYSRREIAAAMDIRPTFARLIVDGKEEVVEPQRVKKGQIIEIKAGEKIPLDGVIVEGSGLLDTSMLTGESVPVYAKEGENVLSGSINKEGILKIKVTANFNNSTVSKILELIEGATSKKSKSENFITKFAVVYTPIVVGLAVLTAIVPPLLTQFTAYNFGTWQHWINTAITFLVISCPCAIVVSVPLGFFAGLGKAAGEDVLVKGSNYLEALNTIDTIVLDKTGTITKGEFGITKVYADNTSEDDLIEKAALLEANSTHPIARSIVKAYEEKHSEIKVNALTEVKEVSGKGLTGVLEGKVLAVGNDKLMKEFNLTVPEIKEIGSHVYVAYDNKYLGCIVVADKIKPDSKRAMQELKQNGIKQIVMLTGDKKDVAEAVAKEVGIDKAYSELLPQDKVAKVEELLKTNKVAFVGDGINDAPVLARADVGIAMGGVGSDAAIEAADIVLMTDELTSITKILKIAKRTRVIVTENIVFALGVKALVLILGFCGVANMWLAIFADVGVALLAILNSIRVLGRNLKKATEIIRK